MIMLKVGLSSAVQETSSISQFGFSIYSDSVNPIMLPSTHAAKKSKKGMSAGRTESDDSTTRECNQVAISHVITKQFSSSQSDNWSKLHDGVYLVSSNSHDIDAILKDRESLAKLFVDLQSKAPDSLPPLSDNVTLIALQCSPLVVREMEAAANFPGRQAVCFIVSESHRLCHYQLIQFCQLRLRIKERQRCHIFALFLSDFSIISFSGLCAQSFLTKAREPIYIFPRSHVLWLPLSVSHTDKHTSPDIFSCFSDTIYGGKNNLTSTHKQHINHLLDVTKDCLAKLFLHQLKIV